MSFNCSTVFLNYLQQQEISSNEGRFPDVLRNMDTKYISVDETTELLGLSNRRIRQLITNGEITALKDKNKWRIDIEELMNSELFLRKSTGNASGTPKEPLRQVSGNASGTTTSNNDIKFLVTAQQLNKENEHLKEQLAEKDKQISNLQESMDHSMQLQPLYFGNKAGWQLTTPCVEASKRLFLIITSAVGINRSVLSSLISLTVCSELILSVK